MRLSPRDSQMISALREELRKLELRQQQDQAMILRLLNITIQGPWFSDDKVMMYQLNDADKKFGGTGTGFCVSKGQTLGQALAEVERRWKRGHHGT